MSETIHLVVVSEIGATTQIYDYDTSNEAQNALIHFAVTKLGHDRYIQEFRDIYTTYAKARRPRGVAVGNDSVAFLRMVKIGE